MIFRDVLRNVLYSVEKSTIYYMARADAGISPYILSVLRYDVGGDAHIAPLIYMFFTS